MLAYTHRSPNPKRDLNRFSRFAWFTSVTDKQRDHANQSVTIDHIYVRSTSTWPNNYIIPKIEWISVSRSLVLLGQIAALPRCGLLYPTTIYCNSNIKQAVKVIWQQAASPPHIDSIPYILQWATPLPSHLPLPMGGFGPLCNTRLPGSTWVLHPNGILIGSTIFAGLTTVTDQQTDRPRYSVCNNRPHLRT